ncbi:FecCD family ABC transporter permease [Amycolatopsis albispora]|uniref:Iron ABC transporter n=1 Tax=Amycolatopsis albispora TaxID=1804986 RepID=A0A344L3T9_9PSEU|nr:iron ABC transporter permease [Amycolatopsis albispora]AXB42713.1 iron ABC transporter [Amycolatopsis albispora]
MRRWLWPGLVLGTVIAALAQLMTGASGSGLWTMLGDETTRRIVLDLRLPRVLVALGAGACLGVAGCVLQSLLRNPLAAPEITGVGSGAVLGAVTASLLGGAIATPHGMIGTAVAGGVLGGGVLWVVAARTGSDPLRLSVLGVLISAVLTGITLILLTARPQGAAAMVQWLVGSLNGRGWAHWQALLPWLVPVLVAAVLAAPVLGVLAVDDDHARGVGLDPARWRSATLLLAVVAAAAAIATVGALAFVGLLAPHAARLAFGADHRLLVPGSALIGAATVCAADAAAQQLTELAALGGQPLGVPTGAITAIAGAVVLVRAARRQSALTSGDGS